MIRKSKIIILFAFLSLPGTGICQVPDANQNSQEYPVHKIPEIAKPNAIQLSPSETLIATAEGIKYQLTKCEYADGGKDLNVRPVTREDVISQLETRIKLYQQVIGQLKQGPE